MPRQDVPYGGAICRLKERIAEIWDRLDEKLHSINGVEGDGAGNVEIVSGDAAITVSESPTGHFIEIGLDHGNLPSATVSSVNGQTGAVRLDAVDIPSDGNSNVQADIITYKAAINDCFDSITSEQAARQNADATLQTNINASNERISVLETEDANDMKLNRDQTAAGDNTFTGRLKAKGQPAYSPSQPTDDVATIGTLNAYSPMVRTTGAQSILGNKTFSDLIIRRIAFFDIEVIPETTLAPNFVSFTDKNGASAGGITGIETTTQSYRIFTTRAKMSDGSVKALSLQLRIDRPTNKFVVQVAWPDGTFTTIAEKTIS